MSSGTEPSPHKLWILVEHKDLKAVQAALLERGLLEQDEPIVYNPRIIQQEFDIVPQAQDAGDLICVPEKPHLASQAAVSTTLSVPSNGDDSTHPGSNEPTSHPNGSVLELLGIGNFRHMVATTRTRHSETEQNEQKKLSSKGENELSRAVQDWYRTLPASTSATLPSEAQLLSSSTWRFTKYSPLLILPAGTFNSEAWSSVFATLSTEDIQSLYAHIAKGVGLTHIAEQAPIPLLQAHDTTSSQLSQGSQGLQGPIQTNILRSPLGLRPLYGAFGPNLGIAAASAPGEDAFAAALWVTVKQHGIAQVFAPLYTMFANGNVNEKRRVRDLAAEDLRSNGLEQNKLAAAAADLYAGIGYFAFSYAKAGYRPVLCWELNAWSIEGLRRGAELNGWTCTVLAEDEELTDENKIRSALACTFVVFHESNDRASSRLARLRAHLPPIRHVNCGYLPSSRPSWPIALDLVDREYGGWLHVHENCDAADVESGASREAILACLLALERQIGGRQVHIKHVERVKSYAPGVLHCVFDACVDPKPKSSGHNRPRMQNI